MTKLAEQLRQGADQAWASLAEGWRELSARASGALTRFRPAPASGPASQPGVSAGSDEGLLPFGGWAFMAADVFGLITNAFGILRAALFRDQMIGAVALAALRQRGRRRGAWRSRRAGTLCL